MRAGMRSGPGVLSYLVKGFACLVVVIGVFGLIWLRSSIRSEEYAIGALEKEHWGVLRERKTLEAGRATLFSAGEIGSVTAEKLGMDFPDRTKVFYVTRDRGSVPYEASYSKRAQGSF